MSLRFQTQIDQVLAQCRDDLTALGFAKPRQIIGCTTEEIAAIERTVSAPLPYAYVAFLKMMGKKAGNLWVGSNVFYPEPLTLNEDALALLRENGDESFWQQGNIAFHMHQGYQFLFVKAGEGDDPPVYHYLEGRLPGTGTVSRLRDSFTQFIHAFVHEEAAMKVKDSNDAH